MGKKKDDDEPSPLKKYLIGISVVAGILIAGRLVLDALGWWAGGPRTLTAVIGVGVIVLVAVTVWWKLRSRSR